MTSSGDQTLLSGEADSERDEAYCAACNQSFSFEHTFCPNDGARLLKLKAKPDQMLGRVFDNRYEVRATLGHGGMGTVYRGWQLSVDREVAIKVIHPKLAEVRQIAKRFLREARLSSRLNQPNIVNVFDFGHTEDGILYLVMEVLKGRTLAKELESRRPMPLRRITSIALQICDALETAHGQGTIHRDLKPGNIIILDDPPGRDFVKILDFGLAKSLVNEHTSLVTQNDALLGTPLYMSPEQVLGRPCDQRADLYSVGCILYQMVSGRPPFVAENLNAILAAQVRDLPPPLPPTVLPAMATTIAKLMNKAPEDRIATAGLLRSALQAIADGRLDDPPAIDVGGESLFPIITTSTVTPAGPVDAAAATAAAPIEIRSRRPHRRWLLVVLAMLVAGAATAAIMLARRPPSGGSAGGGAPSGDTSGAGPADASPIASDAAEPMAVDAAIVVDAAPVPIDAPPDAAVRAPVDAAVRRPPPDAPPRPTPVDARVEPRAIDAAPRSPPDAALPDIDYLPTGQR